MDGDLVKVVAEIPAEPGDVSRESMWAEPLGEGRFRLKNSPWFAYGLSVEDVVRCSEDEIPEIEEVVEAGGHRTLRVIFNEKAVNADEQYRILTRLAEHGVDGERATAGFLALDVPPEADYESVIAYLEELEQQRRLVFEEAWSGEDAAAEAPEWLE